MAEASPAPDPQAQPISTQVAHTEPSHAIAVGPVILIFTSRTGVTCLPSIDSFLTTAFVVMPKTLQVAILRPKRPTCPSMLLAIAFVLC
jgi:hypothetical protein